MTTPEKPHAADPALRRTALAVSMVSSFLTPFMASGVNVAMPLIGREFGLSAVNLGWVLTAYTLAAAMFLVPFGRLADLVGRKRIFTLGIAVNIAGTALCALAPSAFFLILGRGVQGVGGAMIFGTGVAILTSVYPPGGRGHALGLNTAAVYTGLSLGPVLGGFLVHAFGWRSVFGGMSASPRSPSSSRSSGSRASGPTPAASASISPDRSSSAPVSFP